ncbi:hypothetical protein MNBD_PLANCTO03-1797 [hydrothermal vent metagenome]|uniref:Uncharacterized protein n=1 Tax=hydrothermal vent metagenome TaxID=652676 RepID=A0A3B1DWX3_9ZZZZ
MGEVDESSRPEGVPRSLSEREELEELEELEETQNAETRSHTEERQGNLTTETQSPQRGSREQDRISIVPPTPPRSLGDAQDGQVGSKATLIPLNLPNAAPEPLLHLLRSNLDTKPSCYLFR